MHKSDFQIKFLNKKDSIKDSNKNLTYLNTYIYIINVFSIIQIPIKKYYVKYILLAFFFAIWNNFNN